MLAHPESSPPLREPSAKPAIRVPLSRVTYRLTPLLAVLVFVVPAVYLLEVWPRKAPPATEEVNHAPIAIKNGAYHVSLPNGLVYEVIDPTAGVAGESDKARNAVRSRIASKDPHSGSHGPGSGTYSRARLVWRRLVNE